MDLLLQKFRSQTQDALRNLLWRHWCSLGVAGYSEPATTIRLIDPEALLLATTSIGRYEPRLFDEVLDWLSRYGSLINLQRLKNLQKTTALGDENVLSAIADWLVTDGGQPRWKIFVTHHDKSAPVRPLFIGIGGPTPRDPDPLFLAHKLERQRFKPRGMSRAPNPILPPNLLFSLRALIGISARAEVILCLAGGAATHASEIARMTSYAPRTLQALLQEMSLSGHLLTQESASINTLRKGANRRYHLQPSDWAFLTNGAPLPQWFPWAALFCLGKEVLTAIPATDEKPKHPAVISSKLRDGLITHGQSLTAANLLPLLDLRPEAPGDELLQTLAHRLPSVITGL